MRRLFLATTAAAILTLGSSLSVIGIGNTEATLACDDESSMTVVIDAIALTELVSAVQAMLEYPAGLTCTLTQVPVAASPLFSQTALAAGNPNKDYAVGGGRAMIVHRCLESESSPPTAQAETNFGLSAHVDNGSITGMDGIGGSVNFTIPQCSLSGGPSYSGSHLGMKVDCLQVTAGTANLTATVIEKTGVFAVEFQDFNEIAVRVIDDTITGDHIGWEFQTTSHDPITQCNFTAALGEAKVDRGNVNVHDAAP